jgi:hypothetical protein
MNVQDALLDSFSPEVSSAFFLVPVPGESAFAHYARLKDKIDAVTLDRLFVSVPRLETA